MRTEITAKVVAQAEAMLAAGRDQVAIATELGITPYVVGLIARYAGCKPQHAVVTSTRQSRPQRNIDAITVRRIERMLATGWLERGQIAREAGVSVRVVDRVARGVRQDVQTGRAALARGEYVLKRPVRCASCRAMITIVPCRACKTRRVRGEIVASGKNLLTDGKKHFALVASFGQLRTSLTNHVGADAMEVLLPLISKELTAFLTAADRREHLIVRAEQLFDLVVEPVDLPGPDRVIDPVLRAVLRPLVGRLYDEVIRKLELQAHAA